MFPFAWVSEQVFMRNISYKTRFGIEANGNSDMAYWMNVENAIE